MGQLSGPLVADTGNNRNAVFSSSGTPSAPIGSAGTGNAQFNSRRGLTVAADQWLYVVDYSNNRVQKLSATGTTCASGWSTTSCQTASTGSPPAAQRVHIAAVTGLRTLRKMAKGKYSVKVATTTTASGSPLAVK